MLHSKLTASCPLHTNSSDKKQRPRTWKKTTNSVGKPLHSTSVGVAIFFSLIFSYLQ